MDDRAVAHPGTDQLVAVGAQGAEQRLQPVEGEQTQPPHCSAVRLLTGRHDFDRDSRHTAVSFNPGSDAKVMLATTLVRECFESARHQSTVSWEAVATSARDDLGAQPRCLQRSSCQRGTKRDGNRAAPGEPPISPQDGATPGNAAGHDRNAGACGDQERAEVEGKQSRNPAVRSFGEDDERSSATHLTLERGDFLHGAFAVETLPPDRDRDRPPAVSSRSKSGDAGARARPPRARRRG